MLDFKSSALTIWPRFLQKENTLWLEKNTSSDQGTVELRHSWHLSRAILANQFAYIISAPFDK